MKSTFHLLFIFLALVSCTKKDGTQTSEVTTTSAADVGELRLRLENYPKSLNEYVSGDQYSSLVNNFLIKEPLLSVDEQTYDTIPVLAKKWEMSPDKKTYTFYLDERAKFSDGKPVTADDVIFSYELTYDIKRCPLCEPARSWMGPMEKIEKVDDYTVKIKMRNIHFDNLNRVGGSINILPKHIYGAEGKDFSNDFDKVVVGSGPYVLKEIKGRNEILLERNPNFWAANLTDHPAYKGYNNFDRIRFRVISEEGPAFELFKKKQLDFFYIGSTLYDVWDNEKSFPWTDSNVVRFQTPKTHPQSWGGLALNMRKHPFNDKNFRQAAQLLVNRDLICEKVFKNKQTPVTGPFMEGSPYSANLKPIPFDPAKATELLKEIGYTQVENGILYREVKGQKQFAKFELMYSNPANEKWATIVKEDAQKVGVQVDIKFVEWTTATKMLDEHKFDTFAMGWSGNPIPGPEQLFHGSGASKQGSSNYPGLNHPEINRLIEAAPKEFNEAKRTQMYKKIEELIVQEQPYIFLFKTKDHLIGYWKDRIAPPEKPFLKYTGDDKRDPFFRRWGPATGVVKAKVD